MMEKKTITIELSIFDDYFEILIYSYDDSCDAMYNHRQYHDYMSDVERNGKESAEELRQLFVNLGYAVEVSAVDVQNKHVTRYR